MPLWLGLPSLATLLFSQPTRGIIPIINRIPQIRQWWCTPYSIGRKASKNDNKYDSARNYSILPIGSTL